MHGLAVVIHVLCGDGFAFEYRSCDAHIQNLQLCQQGAGLGGSDQVFLVFIADVFDQQGNQVAQFLRFTALSGKLKCAFLFLEHPLVSVFDSAVATLIGFDAQLLQLAGVMLNLVSEKLLTALAEPRGKGFANHAEFTHAVSVLDSLTGAFKALLFLPAHKPQRADSAQRCKHSKNDQQECRHRGSGPV